MQVLPLQGRQGAAREPQSVVGGLVSGDELGGFDVVEGDEGPVVRKSDPLEAVDDRVRQIDGGFGDGQGIT